MEVHVVA